MLSTFGAKGIVIFMNASQLLMHVAPIVGDLNVRLGFRAESPTHHIPTVCSDSNSHSYTKHSLKTCGMFYILTVLYTKVAVNW